MKPSIESLALAMAETYKVEHEMPVNTAVSLNHVYEVVEVSETLTEIRKRPKGKRKTPCKT